MSFTSWLFGDNKNSNSNKRNNSSDDVEVNSYAQYINPMGALNDTYGFSFNVQNNFQPGRSSFHFGHQSHGNSEMVRGPENLDPGRSSFHFGQQSQHYGTPYVSQFQRDHSTSLFPFGGSYEDLVGTSVHVGESNEAYKPTPYSCLDSDVGSTSSYPPPEFEYTEQELTDAFNYPGYLNHGLGSVEAEGHAMGEEEEEEEEEAIAAKRRYQKKFKLLVAKVANEFNLQKRVRIPYHTDGLSGKEWVDNVVNSEHPNRCQDIFGMQPDLFRQLEVELVLEHGFQPPKKSTDIGVRECLGYFIAMLRGYTSQAMDDRFQRSGGTISKHIKKITPALKDFAAKWVAPLQRHEHWRSYLERRKKYCHFKYYLVDAGYPNAKGYLAPYKGNMYHQDEFRRRSVPVTDSNEVFNKAHSSLRSCVERSFVSFSNGIIEYVVFLGLSPFAKLSWYQSHPWPSSPSYKPSLAIVFLSSHSLDRNSLSSSSTAAQVPLFYSDLKHRDSHVELTTTAAQSLIPGDLYCPRFLTTQQSTTTATHSLTSDDLYCTRFLTTQQSTTTATHSLTSDDLDLPSPTTVVGFSATDDLYCTQKVLGFSRIQLGPV
ncbi:hypothetical protein Vadar_028525 [Vaccinium darrowii]|uniref:Uncharacterized protein n=1 Tax=Vaccinium darrowii TaxID=229202 RepID=A0ACB7YZS4_9ERIC|nr:hypothetical protein Vadar_028525 [Vaccinium darrowii]